MITGPTPSQRNPWRLVIGCSSVLLLLVLFGALYFLPAFRLKYDEWEADRERRALIQYIQSLYRPPFDSEAEEELYWLAMTALESLAKNPAGLRAEDWATMRSEAEARFRGRISLEAVDWLLAVVDGLNPVQREFIQTNLRARIEEIKATAADG